jgi:hypothetical protein
MPSKSKAQHNLMAAVANNPAFAKKVGISKSVGEEFMKADKTKKFGSGGALKEVDSSDNPGLSKLPTEVRNKMGYMKKGGMTKKYKEGGMADTAQDKNKNKKAFKMHDSQEHKGEHTNLTKLKKGGMMKKMAMGGKVKETMGPRTMAMDVEKGSNKLTKFGESAVQKRGHTKGKNLGDSGSSIGIEGGGMKKGGKVTKMCGGGMKKMAKGGTASARADGIASKGKTKGKFC